MKACLLTTLGLVLTVCLLVASSQDDIVHRIENLKHSDVAVRCNASSDIHLWGVWFGGIRSDLSGAQGLEKQSALKRYEEQKNVGERLVIALIPLCKDSDERVRDNVVRALGEIQLLPEKAVKALIDCLKNDSSSLVRKDAIMSLLSLHAEEAVPSLIHLLKGRDDVSSSAAYALSELGLTNKAAIEPLLSLLEVPDVSTRINAGKALSVRGENAKAAIPHFIRFLSDPDDSIKEVAIIYLGRMKLELKKTIPALRRFVDNCESERLKTKATTVLKELQK